MMYHLQMNQLIILLEDIIEMKEKINHLNFILIFKYNKTFILYWRENEIDEDVKKDIIFKNLHLQYEGKFLITYTDIENTTIGNYVKDLFVLEKKKSQLLKFKIQIILVVIHLMAKLKKKRKYN